MPLLFFTIRAVIRQKNSMTSNRADHPHGNGYMLYTDQATDQVFVSDIVEAQGHQYGQWNPEGILDISQ